MQIILSALVLLTTILMNYGYYAFHYPQRAYVVFMSVCLIAWVLAFLHVLWHRWNSWISALTMLISAAITFVEMLMTGICGSWYAFVYDGPALYGDRCNLMTGLSITKYYIISSVTIVFFAFISYAIRLSYVRVYDIHEHCYLVGYAKPSMKPWALIASLFTFPYSGKIWVINGISYKYDYLTKSVAAFTMNRDDYVFFKSERRPNIWAGKRWSLFSNCVWGN